MGKTVSKVTVTEARERKRLRVKELANRVGVSLSQMYRIENGETPDPAFSTGLALATELGINPYALKFGPPADGAQ